MKTRIHLSDESKINFYYINSNFTYAEKKKHNAQFLNSPLPTVKHCDRKLILWGRLYCSRCQKDVEESLCYQISTQYAIRLQMKRKKKLTK